MPGPLTARAGVWHDRNETIRPVIRIFGHRGRAEFHVAAVEYADARKLADQLHDLTDAYETEKRENL